MGKSSEIIHHRHELYKNLANYLTSSKDTLYIGQEELSMSYYVVGSKGEGLSCLYESDIDVLCLPDNVLVVEESSREIQTDGQTIQLLMDTENCYPGYCRLQAGDNAQYIEENDLKLLLKTDFMKTKYYETYVRDDSEECLPIGTGPAATGTVEYVDFDVVFAYRCLCPGILHRWAKRKRAFEWPSQDIISKVLSTEACLVAVGSKMNRDSNEEWRICFNKAELMMIECLNETQTKLYILLKMIAKQMLLPKRKEINSYIMKNIVFWMAEMHPQSLFQEKNLSKCLMKALTILEHSILTDFLPYYMIPERNILGETMIHPFLKARLLIRIRTLQKTGPEFILGCPKLKEALTLSQKDLESYSRWRDDVERLFHDISTDNLEEEVLSELKKTLIQKVCPNWRKSYVLRALDEDDLMLFLARVVLKC